MEFDLSELDGKSYLCIDGCGYCCLCQPELDMKELMLFRSKGMEHGLTTAHVQGFVTDEPTAAKMQGGRGACYFLEDRRCTVYSMRPKFCRQFPVRIHALHRIQLNANLSCPGIGQKGEDLREFGASILEGISNKKFDIILADVRDRVKWFEDYGLKVGTHRTPEELRTAGTEIAAIMREKDGIGKVLTFANSEPAIGTMPPDEIADLIRESESPEDLDDVASKGNYSLLELEDPAWLPVYVDDGLQWNAFRARKEKIQWMILEENGMLTTVESYPVNDTPLPELDPDALGVLADYAALLNSRDHFLGYAYHVAAVQHFQYDLMTVYLGLLSTTMLDVWWRAGLVAKTTGSETLDGKGAREGVRAYDMTCLALPTMGEFV